MDPEPGHLLAGCLPISNLAILQGGLILVAEGPRILCYPPDNPTARKKTPSSSPSFIPFQLFPNDSTITGLSFPEDYSTPEEVGVVWAHSSLRLVTITRSPQGVDLTPHPVISLNFIPIAAKWLEEGRRLAIVSLLNALFVYDVAKVGAKDPNLVPCGRWVCPGTGAETLYCATLAGESLQRLVVFSGTSLQGILVWRPELEGGGVVLTHKLNGGHEGIPFSLDFHPQWNLLLSSSDDRSVILWAFSKHLPVEGGDSDKEEEDEYNEILVERAKQMAKLALGDNFDEIEETDIPKVWLPPYARLKRKLLGHEARVWKASWLSYQGFLFILSVGEDSLIRVSSLDETVSKSWRGADGGASIYTSAYDQGSDILYTGSHDGSVRRWRRFYAPNTPSHVPYDKVEPHPWTDHLLKLNKWGRSIVNKDYPRNICLWRASHVLALMNSGRLTTYSFYDRLQRNVWLHPNFARYGVLTVSKSSLFLAVGGLKGEFVLLSTQLKEVRERRETGRFTCESLVERTFPSKIIAIHWLQSDSIVLIVTLSTAYLYIFTAILPPPPEGGRRPPWDDLDFTKITVKTQISCSFSLAHLPRPGVPSALISSDLAYLLLGDEVGGVTLYKVPLLSPDAPPPEEGHILDPDSPLLNLEPDFYLGGCHREGVYSIVEYQGAWLTGGRYGGIKKLGVVGGSLVLEEEFNFPPFDWVCRLEPILKGSELLVGGFHKGSFFLCSWEQGRLLEEIPGLGGGHRRWDWKSGGSEEDPGALVFLRDREIYWAPLPPAETSLNVVLKPGLHSKTVNCGIFLGVSGRSHFIATGSDDTTIRIIEYSTITSEYSTLHQITSHGSSVRALVATPLPPGSSVGVARHLLYSGGGRSELHATIVGLVKGGECTSAGRWVLIGTLNKKRRPADAVDIRIMALSLLHSQSTDSSFTLCAACSDGFLRLVHHTPSTKKFVVTTLLEGQGHALLTASLWGEDNLISVLGGSSNGDLILWRVGKDLFAQGDEGPGHQSPGELLPLPPTSSWPLLSCAVLSMTLGRRSGSSIEILLGGDDCSVSLWRLQLEDDLSPVLVWREDQTQRGGVTGLYYSEGEEPLIYSCSNDQVIAKWGAKSGKCEAWAFGGVRDVQGMIVSPGVEAVTVFGHGISWITPPGTSLLIPDVVLFGRF